MGNSLKAEMYAEMSVFSGKVIRGWRVKSSPGNVPGECPRNFLGTIPMQDYKSLRNLGHWLTHRQTHRQILTGYIRLAELKIDYQNMIRRQVLIKFPFSDIS